MVVGDRALQNWTVSFYLAARNGELGLMKPALDALQMPDSRGRIAYRIQTPASVLTAIRRAPAPVQVLVPDAVWAAELRFLLAGTPQLRATVVIDPSVELPR